MNFNFTELYKILVSTQKSVIDLFSVAILFNFFLFVAITQGQNTITGAFQGDVSNSQTGEPVLAAVIEITSEQTGTVYTPTVDSKGRFYQGLLAPGYYRLSISAPGLRPRLLRREIKVTATDNVIPVPVTLEPESPTAPSIQPSQAVLEEADNIRVEINTIDARREGSFKDETIAKIPLGSNTITRSFDELALLLPGVAPPPQTVGDVAGPGVGPGVGSAGQFAVNGLRSRGNNFTVDGSDNNDEDIGVRRQGFVALNSQPIESVKEFQVITLLAPAQFGRNIGAQVNAVSKAGGNKSNGTIYGFFNSSQLNARNFFDTTNGNDTFALKSASGQSVLLDGQPLLVRNRSGEEDSFTFGQAGGTLGGAVIENKLFYFLSGEYQKINATQEKNFSVPTIEQRGPFGTGASGIYQNFFLNPNAPGYNISAVPNSINSPAVFTLFPFPNNPTGIYGENTFTQTLPASRKGIILSGRLDNNFTVLNKQQSLTGRYNFTDDQRYIPAVNDAVHATVLSDIRTQNVSLFLNSQLASDYSGKQLFNQVRFSFGRTKLTFGEVRNSEFLDPSDEFPDIPFLLNSRLRFNVTQPLSPGIPNTGAVRYLSTLQGLEGLAIRTTESLLGPVGQVQIAGFSTLGVDAYNFPQSRANNTYQLADELSYRFNRHILVLGTDIRRTDLNNDLPRLARSAINFNGAPRLILENGTFRFPTSNDPNPIIRGEDYVGLEAANSFLLTLNIDREDAAKANLRYYQFNFYGQDSWRIRPNLSLSYGLRYEYNSPVHEINRRIEQTFVDPRLNLIPGLTDFIDGRKNLYEPDKNNFAPRVGLAYSPVLFGNRRLSVFRAGYGIFYDQIPGAVINQSRNVFPSILPLNFGGIPSSIGQSVLTFINPAQTSIFTSINNTAVPIRQPGTLNFLNPQIRLQDFLNFVSFNFPQGSVGGITIPTRKLKMPMAQHYSIVYEQQLKSNMSVSVGYVGTKGQNLIRFTTPNFGPNVTVVPTQSFTYSINTIGGPIPLLEYLGRNFFKNPPVSNLGSINIIEGAASSNYNSLQTQLRGRFSDNLNFQLSYTFSKVTDDVSDVFDMAGAYVLPQSSIDLMSERAVANFDIRHRWTYQMIYSVPKFRENSFLSVLTNRLQIVSTGKYHSGQPFTVNSTIDVNLDGNLTDRLNTTQGIEVTGDRSQPLRLTTANPYSLLAPFGQNGQIRRNSFRAGSVMELDLSVIKQFSIYNRRLSFRTDVFNFINRANFGIPVRLLEAPGFGKATNTLTPGRRIQFSLKYDF